MGKEPPRPWENDPNFKPPAPTLRGAGTGAGWKRRIETPDQLFEEFENYIEFAKENLVSVTLRSGEKVVPWTIISFCHFLGVSHMAWVKWRKEREDLKEAIAVVEDRIVDNNHRGGMTGALHAGLVARDLDKHDAKRERQALADQREKQPRVATVGEEHIANIIHPDDPDPLGYDSGIFDRPLYSRAQLDAGAPFFLPEKKAK